MFLFFLLITSLMINDGYCVHRFNCTKQIIVLQWFWSFGRRAFKRPFPFSRCLGSQFSFIRNTFPSCCCSTNKRFSEIVFLCPYPLRDTDPVLQCQRVHNITTLPNVSLLSLRSLSIRSTGSYSYKP